MSGIAVSAGEDDGGCRLPLLAISGSAPFAAERKLSNAQLYGGVPVAQELLMFHVVDAFTNQRAHTLRSALPGGAGGWGAGVCPVPRQRRRVFGVNLLYGYHVFMGHRF
ncbi:hypothetical protein MRX96_028023 [Rhipicephalus microplus]